VATTGNTAKCDAKAKPANLDFVIKDMNGKDVSLADYKGKVILLNFWATWCGPCKYEIPTFVELQDKYRDQGVVFLGLSVDDPVEKLKPFADQYKMNYPVLVGLDREDVQEAFGPMWGIPVTIMIGRDGSICKRHMGLATKEQFEKEIESLL
jgi:thiol-disulfide isomerase/thioredoxin